MRAAALAAALAACALAGLTTARAAEPAARAPLATVPGTEVFMLKSTAGKTYRISVARPPAFGFGGAPQGRTRAVYVLDANLGFAQTAETLRLLQIGGELPPLYVVGIGYPTDDLAAVFAERQRDFTPTPAEEPPLPGLPPVRGGGAAAFLTFMVDVLKPRIEADYPIDPKGAVLAGDSLGGLFVVDALAARPDAFAGYVAISPALWWDGGSVLPKVAAAKGAGRLKGRLYLAAGSREEDNPVGAQAGMIRNTRKLAVDLAHTSGLELASEVLEGETHLSISAPGISRGVRFVLKP